MTIQEWMRKYDISVEFYIRGFRFESPYGAAHQQVIFTKHMPQTFVTFSDVAAWLSSSGADYVSQEALGELQLIVKS